MAYDCMIAAVSQDFSQGCSVVCAHLLLCAAKRVGTVVDINRACAAGPAAEYIRCGTRQTTQALGVRMPFHSCLLTCLPI
jgi:hypothetical protein